MAEKRKGNKHALRFVNGELADAPTTHRALASFVDSNIVASEQHTRYTLGEGSPDPSIRVNSKLLFQALNVATETVTQLMEAVEQMKKTIPKKAQKRFLEIAREGVLNSAIVAKYSTALRTEAMKPAGWEGAEKLAAKVPLELVYPKTETSRSIISSRTMNKFDKALANESAAKPNFGGRFTGYQRPAHQGSNPANGSTLNNSTQGTRQPLLCHKCQKPGHFAKFCPN